MSGSNPLSELDIQRHITEQAARVQVTNFAQMRQAAVQKLLAKIQSLTDAEFETAFTALDSMIETFTAKKSEKGKLEKPDKGEKARATMELLTNKPSQTLKS